MKRSLFVFAFSLGLNALFGQIESPVLVLCHTSSDVVHDTLNINFSVPQNAETGRYYLLVVEAIKAGIVMATIEPELLTGRVRFLLPGNNYKVSTKQPVSKNIDPFRTDHFVFYLARMPELGGPTLTTDADDVMFSFEIPKSLGLTGDFAGLVVQNETVVEANVPGAFSGQLEELDAGQNHAITWNTAAAGAPVSPIKQQTVLYFIHSEARQQTLFSTAGEPDCAQTKQKHKPLTIGVLGGLTYPDWKRGDSDIQPEMGASFGADVNLEFRLARRLGFQVGAAYLHRGFTLSNHGSDQEYNSSHYRNFNYSNVRFTLNEFRLSAHLKLLNFLQLGGYYTLPLSATRKGPLDYQRVQNGTTENVSLEYEYNFLDEQRFPKDANKRRPLQRDYGLSLGIELPATKRINMGLGLQYSLRAFFNPDYGHWNTTGPATDPAFQDFYPMQEGTLRLPVVFIKFGVRI